MQCTQLVATGIVSENLHALRQHVELQRHVAARLHPVRAAGRMRRSTSWGQALNQLLVATAGSLTW